MIKKCFSCQYAHFCPHVIIQHIRREDDNLVVKYRLKKRKVPLTPKQKAELAVWELKNKKKFKCPLIEELNKNAIKIKAKESVFYA